MRYFSEIKDKPVLTEDEVIVGRLEDMIFKIVGKPKITKLVVKPQNKNNDYLLIPVDFLIKINNRLIIQKNFINSFLQENELYLLRNLLDKQIIDLKGSKIVRVNDVALQDKGELTIVGVDVGFLGILRWFGAEELIEKIFWIFGIKITSKFLSWAEIQPLELARGNVKLKIKEDKLKKLPPEDLADYLETMSLNQAQKFLDMLDEKQAIEVIGELNLNYQLALIRKYSHPKLAKIISCIDPDEAADILLALSQKKREKILSLLSQDKKEELLHLLKYAVTDIGSLMTSEFITVSPKDLASDVIFQIRKKTQDFSTLYSIYVVNEKKQLIGVFSLHELILQPPTLPVYKFMVQNVVVVHPTTPLEIALKKMIKYQLSALPVVDEDKKLLGILTFDDLSSEILSRYLKF